MGTSAAVFGTDDCEPSTWKTEQRKGRDLANVKMPLCGGLYSFEKKGIVDRRRFTYGGLSQRRRQRCTTPGDIATTQRPNVVADMSDLEVPHQFANVSFRGRYKKLI